LTMIISEPPMSQAPKPATARSVHFIDAGRTLIVGYLDSKEIVAWTISPWTKLWCHKLNTRMQVHHPSLIDSYILIPILASGSTAWSSGTRTLIASNLLNGIEIFHINDRLTWVRKLEFKIRANYIKQVAFGQQGSLVVSGSDSGEVVLWKVDSGAVFQTLRHGSGHLTSLKCHSPQNGSHRIASGSSDIENSFYTVKVWTVPAVSHFSS
ncbi:hypothetical protein BV25DRAFT_1795450, partial [Artomyces pyxidatus]